MDLTLDNNCGLAFLNDRGLQRNEKAPTYKGEIQIEGTRYTASLWETTTKSGTKMLSIRVEDKVASELERIEKRMEYLRNKSEVEDAA